MNLSGQPRLRRRLVAKGLGHGQNLAQLRQALAALQASEQRYRLIFEANPNGMCLSRVADGLILEANRLQQRMVTGNLREDLVGRSTLSGDLGIWTHPEDRARLVAELLAKGSAVMETEFRHADGHGFPCRVTAVRVELDGEPHLLSVTLDLTEQRQREKVIKEGEAHIRNLKTHLATIIDAMPSILIGLDPHGAITQWNRQAAASTGVSPAAAIGQPCQAILPEFADAIEALRLEALRLGQPATLSQQLIQRSSGAALYDLMVYPLSTDNLLGVEVRIEDVTERTRLQELMIQTDKLMSMGGLAAGMAHEINNPLAIISQAAQNIERRLSADLPANHAAAQGLGLDLSLLKDYFQQRQIPAFMASIHQAVDRAASIVGNLLQLSRKPEVARRPASLACLVEQALEQVAKDYSLKAELDFSGIELQRDFDPDLPLVCLNAIEIEQVLRNLVTNAAHAMAGNPPGRQPRLAIRISREATMLNLELRDNGQGMEEAVRRRVFEPFFSTLEPGVGSGLGLAVSYMIIVQNHQGTLEVDSTPGQGSCFTLRIPLIAGAEHA